MHASTPHTQTHTHTHTHTQTYICLCVIYIRETRSWAGKGDGQNSLFLQPIYPNLSLSPFSFSWIVFPSTFLRIVIPTTTFFLILLQPKNNSSIPFSLSTLSSAFLSHSIHSSVPAIFLARILPVEHCIAESDRSVYKKVCISAYVRALVCTRGRGQ